MMLRLRITARALLAGLIAASTWGAAAGDPAIAQAPPAPPAPTAAEAIRKARLALDRNDSAGALASLDQALRIDPEAPEAFMLLGPAYMALGRHDEAASAFRRAADLLGDGTPAGLDALCGLADALARDEHNEEAVAVLNRVLAADPHRPSIHHDLGKIHFALGRLESAAAEFRQEIALHGDKPGAALADSYEGLGVVSYKLGDDQAALDALGKAPDTVEARYHQGLALARMGRHEEALRALREVLRRDPDHRGALQSLARSAGALHLEDERRQALDRFQELYRQEEQRKAVHVRVKDLRVSAEKKAEAGDMTGAAAEVEAASKLEPDDRELLLDLGRYLYRAGDRARSEAAFRKLLEREPLHAEALYRVGRIRADSGDLEGALASLGLACQVSPLSIGYHVFLAQTYLRAHRAEDGVRELRLARRLSPNDPESSFNLGIGLAQAGALKEAAGELEESVRLGYKEPQVHQALARVYQALGDLERSRKEQEIFDRLVAARGAKP